jgi:hypothetical protein
LVEKEKSQLPGLLEAEKEFKESMEERLRKVNAAKKRAEKP